MGSKSNLASSCLETFASRGGGRAVHTLFDERGVSADQLDAIVAANDGLARGVMDGLLARGVRVPWQLAVVGFDDGIMAQQSPVPLTTVHQPLYRAGEQAIRLLADRMRGEPVEHVVLPTGLVVRHSCGCLDGMGRLQLSAEDLRRRGGRGFELALLERREQILGETRRVTKNRITGLPRGWESQFLNALLDELKGRSTDGFRVALEDVLDRVIEHRSSPAVFHDVVSILWRHLVPCVMADQALRTSVEGMLDGARLAISAATQRVQAVEVSATDVLAERVGETCVGVAAADSVQALAAVIQHRLPLLGIRRLAIAVFARGVVSETIHQILWFEGGPVLIENVPMLTAALPGSVIASGARGRGAGDAVARARSCLRRRLHGGTPAANLRLHDDPRCVERGPRSASARQPSLRPPARERPVGTTPATAPPALE